MTSSKTPALTRLIRTRVAILVLLFTVFFSLILARLAYLQLIRGNALAEMALGERMRPVGLDARRGTIFDRNHRPLAISMEAPALFAVPAEIDDPDQVARQLAPILDRSAAELREQLSAQAPSVWLARKLDPAAAEQIRAAHLPGIGISRQPTRTYPDGGLAGQLLGFVGVDEQGLEGLEAYYDDYLKGQPGVMLAERTGDGHLVPDGRRALLPAQPGDSLILYLDQPLQYMVQRELKEAVETTRSDWGLFVGVDPRTGGILTSAIYPSYDPNHWRDYTSTERRNIVVSNQYEPGSTFKLVTGSSALDAGVVSPSDTFNCPYSLEIGGGVVHDWRYGGHGLQTFIQATENSCNPVFAIVGAKLLGPKRLYHYARDFGFGSRLGVDFPGEAAGILPAPSAVADPVLRYANIGFGQGVAVTPLQIVMAAAAVANGGTLLRPHYVQKIVAPDGHSIKTFGREPIRRVIGPKAAAEFLRILGLVVSEGTGHLAGVKGYEIAGKTGTAEIARSDGRGYSDKRIASFVGILPADDPQFVGLIMLYNLKVNPPYGGDWAAPAFGKIAAEALKYLQIPADASAG